MKREGGQRDQVSARPNISVPAQDQRLNLRMRRGSLTLSTGKLLCEIPDTDSRRRRLPMRYARTLLIGLVATVAFAWSAAAIENADELAGYCQSLKRGAKGAGRHIYIPGTREALTCWGYMQAMQDLSVLADENGHRTMGACPPEQTTTLQLISIVRPLCARASQRASGQCCGGDIPRLCERPTRAALSTETES